MSEFKNKSYCDACSCSIQMGQGIYEGVPIPTYGILVCRSCYKMNGDGWHTDWENNIIAIAKSKGLPLPERNEKGYLPLK